MMKIILHPNFKKSYQKRILLNTKLDKQAEKRINLFVKNLKHPSLKDHPLKGSKRNDRAFSITGDIRIVYRYLNSNTILFLDIGTHNQVYK